MRINSVSLYFWYHLRHLSPHLRLYSWDEALPLVCSAPGRDAPSLQGLLRHELACASPYTWVPSGISAFRSTQTMPERM